MSKARPEVIAKAVAEQEFKDFLTNMDIYVNDGEMDLDERSQFLKNKGRIIRAIQCGDLTFNEDGEAVYKPFKDGSSYKDSITFHERTGATIMAMDNRKKGHDAAKMYAMLGDLTKPPTRNIFRSCRPRYQSL